MPHYYYKFKSQDIADKYAESSNLPILSCPDFIISKHAEIGNFTDISYYCRSVPASDLAAVPPPLDTDHTTFRSPATNEIYDIYWSRNATGFVISFDTWSSNLYARRNTSNDGSVDVGNLVPYDLGPDSDWSTPKTKQITYANDYLKEQIRARYGFFDRPRNGLSNVIMDSFFPRLLYANNMNIHSLADLGLPRTACAISPLVANILNIRQVPIDQLIRVLGYLPKDIKTLMQRVKSKQYTFAFAGAGGTGMNTAHFLRELSRLTGTINIFRKIYIYDNDTVELSNMLRFPVDLRSLTSSSYGSTAKVSLLEPLVTQLSTNKVETFSSYISDTFMPYELYNNKQIRPNTVVYGAPSVESRNTLSKAGGFICATHASTTASVWLNPHQDEDIQVESYGMIQLGGFFMNQLKMTITLLETLASDSFDPTAQDLEILDFEFDGTIQRPTDRTYQWQIDRNLLMMTADQANNI